jgi:hypothetical protein
MFAKAKVGWDDVNDYTAERLEWWIAAKDDEAIAWTSGSGRACCGGGMLVFTKAA